MDKIKIGEYIRTKTHGIKRVIRINEKATKNRYIVYYGIDKEGDKTYITINIDDIINHSKNLIDLIEAGDIVNGNFVCFNEDIEKLGYDFIDGDNQIYFESIYTYANLPREILTKEQYNQNCYKVEE